MKLLHIDSSILGEHAASRPVTAEVVKKLKKNNSGLEIIYRDLAAAPLPHLTLDQLASGDTANPAQAESKAVLDEFLSADIIVIGAPMYNFTIPSQLKSWIDRILVAGVTFRYTDKGVEGLAGGKRVIIAVARGGLYGPGSPAEESEHVERYLKTVFGFIGVAEPEFIIAEGLKLSPKHYDAALTAALQQASELQAA